MEPFPVVTTLDGKLRVPEMGYLDFHVLAVLIDEFWKEPSKELAVEIRLQGQRFGLSPLSR